MTSSHPNSPFQFQDSHEESERERGAQRKRKKENKMKSEVEKYAIGVRHLCVHTPAAVLEYMKNNIEIYVLYVQHNIFTYYVLGDEQPHSVYDDTSSRHLPDFRYVIVVGRFTASMSTTVSLNGQRERQQERRRERENINNKTQ